MPLVPSTLASSLQADWLAHDGGGFADSVSQSGDRFAQAVSTWFSTAMAATFPCATASARKGQLAVLATAALQVGQAPLAGLQLAMAVVAYLTGQVFGPGVASPPTAAAVAQSAFASVFADLDLAVGSRAD